MPEKYSLGLVGYPLDHSLSPRLHMAALRELGIQGEYLLYPVEKAAGMRGLLEELRSGSLHGLNVTIPHKRSILSLMDVLTPEARAIGSANTVFCQEGQLVGENTDAAGFLSDLQRLGWAPFTDQNQLALVLGAGGSARAVVYALAHTGWQVVVAARRREQAAGLVQHIHDAIQAHILLSALHLDHPSLNSLDPIPALIINTTPVGMFPQEDTSPWPENLNFPNQAALYDLVYNPPETVLMSAARKAGLQVANGLGMLVEQAALSFEIWTGLNAPRQVMHQVVREFQIGG
jgi:shikimate dehydrogenase